MKCMFISLNAVSNKIYVAITFYCILSENCFFFLQCRVLGISEHFKIYFFPFRSLDYGYTSIKTKK